MPELTLVCATKGRRQELGVFLQSIVEQSYRDFEVIVVDQNAPGFLDEIIGRFAPQLPLRHIRITEFGGSLARNLGARESSGQVLCFPDDDCEYPPSLLAEVMRRFAADRSLDLFSGSCRSKLDGSFATTQFAEGKAVLTVENFWNRHIAFTLFVKRDWVFRVGFWDERMGVGRKWGSTEETDFVLRLLSAGACGHYDADVFAHHPSECKDGGRQSLHRAWSYGLGWGAFVRKHLPGPHGRLVLSKYLVSMVRSLGGCVLMVLHLRFGEAKYYACSFAGRGWGLLACLR